MPYKQLIEIYPDEIEYIIKVLSEKITKTEGQEYKICKKSLRSMINYFDRRSEKAKTEKRA